MNQNKEAEIIQKETIHPLTEWVNIVISEIEESIKKDMKISTEEGS